MPLTFARKIASASILVCLVVLLAGCFLLNYKERAKESRRAERLNQIGVVKLPDGAGDGELRFTFVAGNFEAKTLYLPAGKYQLRVANTDHNGDIGFYLSHPDQYGRLADRQLVAKGGISKGEEQTFEAEFIEGNVYFYSEPITQTSTQQIVVEAPLQEYVAAKEEPAESLGPVESLPLIASESPDLSRLADIELEEEPAPEFDTTVTDASDTDEAEPIESGEDSEETSSPDDDTSAPDETEEEEVLTEDTQKLLDAYFRAKSTEDGSDQ
jgi:hypothetical protein